jgi:hypothetical protein
MSCAHCKCNIFPFPDVTYKIPPYTPPPTYTPSPTYTPPPIYTPPPTYTPPHTYTPYLKFCSEFCKNEYIKDFKACSVCKTARQVEICDNDCGYGVCSGEKCEFDLNHTGFKCGSTPLSGSGWLDSGSSSSDSE